MKSILVLLIALAALIVFGIIESNSAQAQQIIMTPGAGGQLYPAYVDPAYGIDGRNLVPQDRQHPVVIYESIVPEGRSQRSWRVENWNGQWMAIPMTSDSDDRPGR